MRLWWEEKAKPRRLPLEAAQRELCSPETHSLEEWTVLPSDEAIDQQDKLCNRMMQYHIPGDTGSFREPGKAASCQNAYPAGMESWVGLPALHRQGVALVCHTSAEGWKREGRKFRVIPGRTVSSRPT